MMSVKDPVVVEGIPVSFDLLTLAKDLHIDGKPAFIKRLEKLAREAEAVAQPKGVAILSSITVIDDEHTKIDEVTFTSPLMGRKMGQLNRVFPYLATEGTDLAAWSEGLSSTLDQMLSTALREKVVLQYREHLENKLLEQFGMKQLSAMSPGSLEIWPIEQQAELFQLMGPIPGDMNLMLTEAFMMMPEYSVSGVYFETETKYYNCQLCPRETCRNRKAPYQAA